MAADPAEIDEEESLALLDALRSAIGELTIFCSSSRKPVIDTSALFYPLIGLALGAVSLAIDHFSRVIIGRVGASIAVVLAGALLTGARPALGLARALVALSSGRRDRALRRLISPATPAVWVVAICILAAYGACLSLLVTSRPVGLVFAPLLGRWSMVVLAVGARAARADGRRFKFAPRVTFREFGWASTTTFGFVFGVAEFLGVVLGGLAAIWCIGTRVALHRWLDGVTQTTLDALCALVELSTIALLVALG